MTEKLLQFIWQFQYFNKSELETIDEEKVQIQFAGQLNSNQGPDFSDAKIVIGKTIWAGTVELHIKTSDWNKHNHQTDKNYKNVILHVVWEDDGGRNSIRNSVSEKRTEQSSVDQTGSLNSVQARTEQNSVEHIPVLELKGRVSKILLQRYEELMNSNSFIPCEKSINTVKEITWKSWKDRLLVERLVRKSQTVEIFLNQNNFHWEETFWWLLAKNFGIKVNADAFEAIARSISINILAKHKTQIHQLEALLLGQAGLLDEKFTDDYPLMLQKEYKFYKSKYNLKPISLPVFFLRMRPGNFPTIRLAQLAMLVQNSAHLFSKIKEADAVKDVKAWLDVTANDYWHYRYKFDEESAYRKKKLGAAMIYNIIINTVCPVLFAYGNYHDENKFKEKALKWLEQTSAEKNNITKGFQLLGIENKTAFDSQGLIELKNEYCNKKRCLECGVGNAILKND
ncbi:MAG: DUF2851 family protein [Chitinophagaceae bacterium]|nr:DUF2851 family protein [Chitinophagaceae bacterium]